MTDNRAMQKPPPLPPKPPLPTAPTAAPALPPAHAAPAHRVPPRRVRLWRDARAWLVAYAALLAAIAFWPTPVDSGAGPLLRAITRLFPILTYHVIEFGANIVLFVPLGLLTALLLPTRRYLVVPIALIATVAIEGLQGILLGARTSSVLDVIANTVGACVGLVLAEIASAARRRARPH